MVNSEGKIYSVQHAKSTIVAWMRNERKERVQKTNSQENQNNQINKTITYNLDGYDEKQMR